MKSVETCTFSPFRKNMFTQYFNIKQQSLGKNEDCFSRLPLPWITFSKTLPIPVFYKIIIDKWLILNNKPFLQNSNYYGIF